MEFLETPAVAYLKVVFGVSHKLKAATQGGVKMESFEPVGVSQILCLLKRSWLEVVLVKFKGVKSHSVLYGCKKCIFNSHVQSCCQKFLNFNNNLALVHTKVKTEASKAKESFNLAWECLTIIAWTFAVFVRSCIQYCQCSSSALTLAMQPNPFMAVRMVFWRGLKWLNHLFLKSFEVPTLFFSQVVEITHLRVPMYEREKYQNESKWY